MNAQEQIRFDAAYQNHLTALNLQGKTPKIIKANAIRRAPRRAVFRSRVPDDLNTDKL